MDRDKVRYLFCVILDQSIYLFDLFPLFICLPVYLIVCLPFRLFPLVCMSLCHFSFCLRVAGFLHIPCVFCPSQVTKPSAQIGFIRFVLIPLFEALEQLFPVLEVTNTHLYKFFSTAIQLPTKSVSVWEKSSLYSCNHTHNVQIALEFFYEYTHSLILSQ